MYSRAGAAYVRTTTSPAEECSSINSYRKQLQKRFARSEGLSEGKGT